MVLPEERNCMETTTTTRSKKTTLHNFNLPSLKWGSYRHLRCIKRSSEHEEEGIEEFRLKLISDLKTITESMLRKQNLTENSPEKKKKREVSPVEVKPWNLRKRRAAPVIETETETEETTKFASTLMKKEIEDDYMVMIGHRPPRRPKKRARAVQRQIDVLYPAYYFSEITQDIYKVVDDVTENVKR